MDKREKLLLAGAAVVGLGVVAFSQLGKKQRPPVSNPPVQTWPYLFGANNYAAGGSSDRFRPLEDALDRASFVGDNFAEWDRYAGLPFSNTQGGVFRHAPGIEFTGGFTDAISVHGSHLQYQGDNPIEFQEAFILPPPWER